MSTSLGGFPRTLTCLSMTHSELLTGTYGTASCAFECNKCAPRVHVIRSTYVTSLSSCDFLCTAMLCYVICDHLSSRLQRNESPLLIPCNVLPFLIPSAFLSFLVTQSTRLYRRSDRFHPHICCRISAAKGIELSTRYTNHQYRIRYIILVYYCGASSDTRIT